MNYLGQLSEKISLFQLISIINNMSLVLNFIVSTIFRKTMGVTMSFTGYCKSLLESDDEDSSVTLIRMNTGMILIIISSVVISIISFWLGLDFFLKANTVACMIIPAIDGLPMFIDCYLNGRSYSKSSYFLIVIFVRTLFANISISIIALLCEWLCMDAILFKTDGNQVPKLLIIALLILLVLGTVYTICNSIYVIWAYVVPSKIPETINRKIKKYLTLQTQNNDCFEKGIKDINYDSRMHPYVPYQFLLTFRFFGVVLALKCREIYYSAQLAALEIKKQYIESHPNMLTFESYRNRINVIIRVALITLLLTMNILLATSDSGYEVCTNFYELMSTVIIIPIILDSLKRNGDS